MYVLDQVNCPDLRSPNNFLIHANSVLNLVSSQDGKSNEWINSRSMLHAKQLLKKLELKW